MSDPTPAMNIYQKLAEIRKQVEVMRKTKKGFNFTYVPEDEILAKVTVYMRRFHLSLVPSISAGTTEVSPISYTKTRVDKAGKPYTEEINEVIVKSEMTWTWINNDDPEERVVVPWVMVGQQGDASQAFGAGLTYSSRYFLLKYFNIATSDDDPDKFRDKQKKAEAAEDALVAEAIIRDFDVLVRSYLAANPEAKEDVKKFITGYVKNGDYFTISQSAVAAKLMSDFRDKYRVKE